MTPESLLFYVERYSAAKRGLGEALGVSDDLLHVHLGLTIFVASALVLRQPMRSWWPLSIVAVLAVLNEVVDYLVTVRWSPLLSGLDVVNSLFWPLVLFCIARRSQARARGSRR